MSALFRDFAAASMHARELAVSSYRVVGVFSDDGQWIIQPLDEDPVDWMKLIRHEHLGLESHSIDSFFEYQAANDASFI
jgi:hypothetical protein